MKSSISIQIALTVTLLALLGSVVVSVLYYFQTYNDEVALSKNSLLQLGETVQSTASIAAYLNDGELAKEVIQGLLKNEIVDSVKITSVTGLAVPEGVIEGIPSQHVVHIKLESPFTPGEVVGELLLVLKQAFIEMRAQNAAVNNAFMLGGYTLFIAFMVFLLIQWRFISGIKQIAVNLGSIIPG